MAIKLPGTLYVMAKSAGALSLDAASDLAQSYNGSAAGLGREIAAAALNATTGEGGERANATAAKLYWQACGLINGALPARSHYRRRSSQQDAGRAGRGRAGQGRAGQGRAVLVLVLVCQLAGLGGRGPQVN